MCLYRAFDASVSMQERFLPFPLSVSCSRFPSKFPRPFRLGGWRGGFASYAPVRRAARRRRARRPFGIYKRHIGPNGSDGSASGVWLFYDLG